MDWQYTDTLMQRIQLADAAAAEELVTYCGRWVRACLHLYLDDQELIDDLLQDLFMDLVENPRAYTIGTNFSAFLKTKVKFTALSAIRARQRRQVAMRRHADQVRIEIGEHLIPHSDQAVERLLDLQRCREGLAPYARDLITLRYEGDHSIAEIAQTLARSPDWVRATLNRIRLELARCLDDAAGAGT